MKDLKKLLELPSNKRSLENFLKLPRRAQEIIWMIATHHEYSPYLEVAYCITEEDLKNLTKKLIEDFNECWNKYK